MEKFKLPESINAERIVLLRSDHEHDADIWQAIQESRQSLREYLFWVDKTEQFKDVVKSTDFFNKKWEIDDEWRYCIYTAPHREFLGCISVQYINFLSQNAEIGYWLRLSETQKGYMSEAVSALEKALFVEGMHRLVIKCDNTNFNSANVAKRCGYKLESISPEAVYHYTGLHDLATYVKYNPKP